MVAAFGLVCYFLMQERNRFARPYARWVRPTKLLGDLAQHRVIVARAVLRHSPQYIASGTRCDCPNRATTSRYHPSTSAYFFCTKAMRPRPFIRVEMKSLFGR